MKRSGFCLMAAVALAVAAAWGPQPAAFAQVPAAAAPATGTPGAAYSPANLEQLVGPFALYPDDLVAIILPASTFPLQLVQADRFLDKRKGNPKLAIDDAWDDSVKSLVNYPEVVKKMSSDLEWTEALGEAVVSSSGAVMEAVQAFRRKAQAAGNLKTDAKQVVQVEQQVINIAPADPTVIYVPQYTPTEVVVSGGAPYYAYSPPYPVYYYPYAPGAALAAGVIWGAAIGAAWGGGRYGANYNGGNNNITINRGSNNNVGSGNVGNRGGGNSSTWKSSKQPGQVGSSGNRAGNTRVGDRPSTGTMGGSAGQRSGQGGAGGGGGLGGDGGRGSGPSASTRPSSQGGAFGGMDSGASANRDSARGQESRGSAAAPRASTGAGGGGHVSGGGGGGGARAGGGGGGGGARGGGGGGGRGGGGGGGRR